MKGFSLQTVVMAVSLFAITLPWFLLINSLTQAGSCASKGVRDPNFAHESVGS